jgi:hypothetical protein
MKDFCNLNYRRVRISGVFGVGVELAETVRYGHVQEQTVNWPSDIQKFRCAMVISRPLQEGPNLLVVWVSSIVTYLVLRDFV